MLDNLKTNHAFFYLILILHQLNTQVNKKQAKSWVTVLDATESTAMAIKSKTVNIANTFPYHISPNYSWGDYHISPNYSWGDYHISPNYSWGDYHISPNYSWGDYDIVCNEIYKQWALCGLDGSEKYLSEWLPTVTCPTDCYSAQPHTFWIWSLLIFSQHSAREPASPGCVKER